MVSAIADWFTIFSFVGWVTGLFLLILFGISGENIRENVVKFSKKVPLRGLSGKSDLNEAVEIDEIDTNEYIKHVAREYVNFQYIPSKNINSINKRIYTSFLAPFGVAFIFAILSGLLSSLLGTLFVLAFALPVFFISLCLSLVASFEILSRIPSLVTIHSLYINRKKKLAVIESYSIELEGDDNIFEIDSLRFAYSEQKRLLNADYLSLATLEISDKHKSCVLFRCPKWVSNFLHLPDLNEFAIELNDLLNRIRQDMSDSSSSRST